MSDSVFRPDNGLDPHATDREQLAHVDAQDRDARWETHDRANRHTPITVLYGLPPVAEYIQSERAQAAEFLAATSQHLAQALTTAERAHQHGQHSELDTAPVRLMEAVTDCIEAAVASVNTARSLLITTGDTPA